MGAQSRERAARARQRKSRRVVRVYLLSVRPMRTSIVARRSLCGHLTKYDCSSYQFFAFALAVLLTPRSRGVRADNTIGGISKADLKQLIA